MRLMRKEDLQEWLGQTHSTIFRQRIKEQQLLPPKRGALLVASYGLLALVDLILLYKDLINNTIITYYCINITVTSI